MSKQTGAENIRWDLSDLFSSIKDPQIQIAIDISLQIIQTFIQTSIKNQMEVRKWQQRTKPT